MSKFILFLALCGPELLVMSIMLWFFGRMFYRLRKENREHRASMIQIRLIGGKDLGGFLVTSWELVGSFFTINFLFLIVNIRNARRNTIVARTTARLQGKGGDIFDSMGSVAGNIIGSALRSHIGARGGIIAPIPTPTPSGGKSISK